MARNIGNLFESSEKKSSGSRPIDVDLYSEKDISKARSLISAPIKGALKELREAASSPILGGMLLGPSIRQAEQSGLISTPEQFSKKLEEKLPTRSGFLEEGLERGGRIAPYAALGGIPALLRGMAGGIAGQAVKEMGGSTIPQAIAEIATQGIPGLGKKIVPKSTDQAKILDFLRKQGLSEQEIAPLLQEKSLKTSFLSKFAYKGKGTQEKLKKSKESVSDIYNSLSKSPEAQKFVTSPSGSTFLQDSHTKLMKMPAELRKIVWQDFLDLLKSGGKGSDFINFRTKINYYYGRGHKLLGGLLDPTDKAIRSISPELAENLNMTNQIFKNSLNLSNQLKPSAFEELMKMGRKGRVVLGMALHNPLILAEAIGEAAAKKLSTEMLTNPRFQNLSLKMIHNLNKGKFGIAKDLYDSVMKDYDSKEQNQPS